LKENRISGWKTRKGNTLKQTDSPPRKKGAKPDEGYTRKQGEKRSPKRGGEISTFGFRDLSISGAPVLKRGDLYSREQEREKKAR